MKSERIMEEEICAEVEYLKFRSVTEEKAKMLYEEYDMRYRRALETRRGDPVYFYTLREDNGEWVCSGNIIHFNEGNEFYIPVQNSKCICTHDENENIIEIEASQGRFYKVIPETVGQYTGLIDRNGTKIFEGDILKHHVQSDVLINTGVVNWDSKNARWALQLNTMNPCFYLHKPETVEVIGNIYDNHELLEREETILNAYTEAGVRE